MSPELLFCKVVQVSAKVFGALSQVIESFALRSLLPEELGSFSQVFTGKGIEVVAACFIRGFSAS
jgi:hypothetical protein